MTVLLFTKSRRIELCIELASPLGLMSALSWSNSGDALTWRPDSLVSIPPPHLCRRRLHERPPPRGETVKFADDRQIRKADGPVSKIDSDEETIPPPRIQRKKFRILTPSDEEVEGSEAETPKPRRCPVPPARMNGMREEFQDTTEPLAPQNPHRRPSPLPPRRRNVTMEECEEAQVLLQNPRRSPSASWAPLAQRKNMVVEDALDGDDKDIYWGGDNKDNKEEKERNEDGGGDGDADDEDNNEGGEGGSDNDDEEEDNPDHSPDGFWSQAPTNDLPRPQRQRPSPRSRSYSPNQEPQPDSPSEQMKQRRRRCKRTNNIVHDAADVAQLKAEVSELCDVDLLNIRKLGMIKVADPHDVQVLLSKTFDPI
ncbi:hypothetical protein BDN71DRAFT_1507932 [Pleurotus eryngii]|uniref:Uncharacterized protein n=1 Tax=Pleurotus eryngii TaxID=5323 RepID=A0A9P5ZYT4_PLEER|nr:hypothetical protein BDN71DRAFT_1507932 [Pleurotus eryngii]